MIARSCSIASLFSWKISLFPTGNAEEFPGLHYKASDKLLARLRGMDDSNVLHELYEIGGLAAEKQVKAEHWIG